MRKFLAIGLSLLMFISAVPVSANTEGHDEAAFDDVVWVGGIQVTADNMDDVLGDGGSVKYDPETDTLTLTDATILNEAGHGIYANGINLTVNGIDTEAEGSNTITGKCMVESGLDEEGYEYTSTEPGCGILVEGDGFGENGGLTITGVIGDITGEEDSGISAYQDIVISGTVGDIHCTGGIAGGISSSFGNVIVEKSGHVGNISSEYDGIEASAVIIEGTVGNVNGGGYAGIHAIGGDVVISGNAESIVGLAGGIEAYSDIDWDEEGNEVYTGGSVTIYGTIVKISGGIMGIRTDADCKIGGSLEVTATDREAENSCAISAGGNIVLPDGRSIISEPADYHIGTVLVETYEDQNGPVEVWHQTVCDVEGNKALAVKIEGFINPFEDVHTSDWYYGDVEYAVLNSLMKGVTDTAFAPDGKLTRAMLVTILYRAISEPKVDNSSSFSDVDAGAYYANAVSWAKEKGIVSGVTETEFAPDADITREQIAAILYRYVQYKRYDTSRGGMLIREFSDYEEISAYAIDAMTWAVNMGIISGKGNNRLDPQANATRAETAAIFHRLINAHQ